MPTIDLRSNRHVEVTTTSKRDILTGKYRYTITVASPWGTTIDTMIFSRDAAIKLRNRIVEDVSNRSDVDSVHANEIPTE